MATFAMSKIVTAAGTTSLVQSPTRLAALYPLVLSKPILNRNSIRLRFINLEQGPRKDIYYNRYTIYIYGLHRINRKIRGIIQWKAKNLEVAHLAILNGFGGLEIIL